MKACKNCRFGDRITDAKTGTYYMCRFWPPKPQVLMGSEGGNSVVWVQPSMIPNGWCGQFKLAFWRWLFQRNK